MGVLRTGRTPGRGGTTYSTWNLKEAKASGADTFIAYSYPPDTFMLTNTAVTQGYNPKVFHVGVGTAFARYGAVMKEKAEGVMGLGGWDPKAPGAEDYQKRLVALTNQPGDAWAAFGLDRVWCMTTPVTATKNSETREVPMIPDMSQLLQRLRSERVDETLDTPVMRVRECQKAMNRAAKVIGMHRVTHHDLRHLFATRCIESGVDIPTVSRWLGHKDGGALAMKVYGHLRDQHSVEMAQKVTFSSLPEK